MLKGSSNFTRSGLPKKWNGSAVFWQVDSNGQVHAGKIMGYDAKTGHRLKVPHPHVCWVHTELRLSGFNLCQCFFGEHLLVRYSDKTVFIVESEDGTHRSPLHAGRLVAGDWRKRTAVSTKRPFVYWRIGMWY